MPHNPNVRFGRKINPIAVKDVQKGNVQRLFNPLSTDVRSANITVGVEPVVLVAFGLKPGESVDIFSVFDEHTQLLYVAGEPVGLDDTHTIRILPVAGTYCVIFNGDALGDLVVIAYKISAMDPDAAKSVDLTNPYGPQHNQPNLFLDGSYGTTETKPFFVGSTPMVFRAYGLEGQTLELYSVFDSFEAPVIENSPVVMGAQNSTLVISIAGQYKFKVVGESDDIILVANPTVLNYVNDGLGGEPGTNGVTFVGTGTGLTGGPIISSGTISLNSATQASLALADSALQSGDNVSELVNNVGYIDNDDIIDGGNF